MSKETFKENLIKTVNELIKNKTEIITLKFLIKPIEEKNKKMNSTDDYLRLWLFSDRNIKGRVLSLDQVIDLFSGHSPLFPIWINVSIKEIQECYIIFELETSLRFRKPSLLQNQETGHPPFKAINNNL